MEKVMLWELEMVVVLLTIILTPAGAATMNCWTWTQRRGHMNEYATDCWTSSE